MTPAFESQERVSEPGSCRRGGARALTLNLQSTALSVSEYGGVAGASCGWGSSAAPAVRLHRHAIQRPPFREACAAGHGQVERRWPLRTTRSGTRSRDPQSQLLVREELGRVEHAAAGHGLRARRISGPALVFGRIRRRPTLYHTSSRPRRAAGARGRASSACSRSRCSAAAGSASTRARGRRDRRLLLVPSSSARSAFDSGCWDHVSFASVQTEAVERMDSVERSLNLGPPSPAWLPLPGML